MSVSASYGTNLKLNIEGASHASEMVMTLSGFPAGFRLDTDKLCSFLALRAPGRDSFATARKESDIPVFTSGLTGNVTNGDIIRAVIKNENMRSGDYSFSDTPRPSHADYAAVCKYGKDVDLRGGGHFSGRLTAMLCVAGGICLQYLSALGIEVGAHILSVAGIQDTPLDPVCPSGFEALNTNRFPVIDGNAGERMKAAIEEAKKAGDSLGGIVECAVTGLAAGLGEHMFAGVEGRVSSLLFSIPAVKGVEFGLGFGVSSLRGSENNDPFYTDGRAVYTKTNNCGGILGGMTNGMPLVFRAAFKPTPSIAIPQDTVSLSRMENVKIKIGGRHDPCIVPRAVPAVRAAAAIAVCDIMLDAAPERERSLDDIRADIDLTDRELVNLFCRRMGLSGEVAQLKRASGRPVFDEQRETALLDRVKTLAKENGEECRDLYKTILSLSRARQKKLLGQGPALGGFKKMQAGLLGKSLKHSHSPEIHSFLADYDYRLYEIPEEGVPGFLKNAGFDALNVTVPYKKTVIPYLDALSETARRVGSVNTIIKRPDGTLYGDNTDYYGFVRMAEKSGIELKGKNVLIFGAGGAGASVRAALEDLGALVIVVSHAENTPENLSRFTDADVIVNTTPVGMYPKNGEAPVDISLFPKLSGVLDLIYNPSVTALLYEADKRGIPNMNGLHMLVSQAKRAAELFTGRDIADGEIDRITDYIRQKNKNIILVGMPGCGKSEIGRQLSRLTGKTFFDTDEIIKSETGRSPANIILEDGEEAFRVIEAGAVQRAGKECSAVIATGGGTVKRAENYLPLHQNGVIVFIKRDPETLIREGRPLSRGDIHALYTERLPLYKAFCDIELDIAENSEKTAELILEALK